MLNMCYLEKLRNVDINKVTTYPKSSDSLDYKLMLATFYSLVDVDIRKTWDQERVKGTWSGFIYNKLDRQLLIQESISTLKEEKECHIGNEIDSYFDRAKRALDFSFLLRGKAIVNYPGYETILYLQDNNKESILDNKELVRKIVTERFKYVFYVKNDSAVLIDVEELRKNFWRER